MYALARKAYRDITKRRLRSLLTIAGVMIGVAGIAAIVSTGENLAAAQQAAYANASQADISFWVWDAPPSTIRAVDSLPNVRAAELRSEYFTRCNWLTSSGSGRTARDVSVKGIADFEDLQVDQVFLKSGRLPKEGEFVAEQSAVQAAPLHIGDTVTCRARGGGPWLRLTLVGVVQSPNYPSATILDYLTFFTPSSDANRLLGTAGSNGLVVRLASTDQARETADEIVKLLDRRGISHGTPTIRDPQNYVGRRELDALLLLLLAFSVVGLVTSGFLVANTLAAIVAEQVGEIGTIKAVGGTRGQILTIYLVAAGLYGLAGTALGLVVGALLSWKLFDYVGSLLALDTRFEVSPAGMVLGIAVGLGVTLVSGSLPAFSATYIPIKQALESYGITSTFGQGRLDRFLRRLTTLPPLAAMSLRNLARRQLRTLVTVFVIAIAVAVLVAGQAVSQSVDSAIDGLFKTYRADAWVYFGDYVSTTFADTLRGLPFVKRSEVWSLDDTWVTSSARFGQVAARARLWGLPADTTLYSAKVVRGGWYGTDETDAAVVSSDLALAQGLDVGDWIGIEAGNKSRQFRIVGIAVDNSVFLGSQVAGKVFVREDVLADMRGRPGYGLFFAVLFDAHDSVSVQDRLDQITARFKGYEISSDSAAREVRGAKEQTRILSLALVAMSVLVGLIGALGMMNTLTLNVLERRREIGVLRSLGASDKNLIQAFLTEGLTLGAAGWVVGLVLGYPLGMLLVRIMQSVLFQIDYVFTIPMMLISFAFAVLLSGAASLFPALGAARLKVGQVLRYE
ncbi:MAG: FtsX-like permease family protein [Rudaea sp.]